MKKIIMILASGVFCTSLLPGFATAQSATDITFAASGPGHLSAPAGKENALPAEVIKTGDKTAIKEMKANLKAAKASLKVNNHLSKHFKNASGIVWNIEEKVMVASFKMEEQSVRIFYNKRGNWMSTILTYHEDQLPQETRSLVKNTYDGFSISLVQEIRQGDLIVYLVHLENCNRYKQILVCNDEITVYKDFEKSR